MLKNKNTKAHTRYRLKPTESFPKGEIVPGVTSILDGQLGWSKRSLITWARNQALKGNDPDKIRDEAADVGTCSDYLIGCLLTKVEPDIKDFTQRQIESAQKAVEGFKKWWAENHLDFVGYQIQVISERYHFGGTIDLIFSVDSLLWICDMKHSRSVWPEHKIQLAAYMNAYQEQENKMISECFILHLKDDYCQPIRIMGSELEVGWEVFKHLRALYDLQKSF